MSKQRSRLFEGLLLFLLSCICGIFAAGEVANHVYVPSNIGRMTFGIYPDGWIQDGATLDLEGLMHRGNYLSLALDPWRPPGNEPARLAISVCGQTASEFQVTNSNEVQVFLKGDCEPRRVTFHVLNPFNPSGDDDRQLGVKLIRAHVGSRAGIPLMNVTSILLGLAAVLILTMGVYAAFYRSRWRLLAFSMPILCSVFLALTPMGMEKIFPLWLFFACLVCGAAAAANLLSAESEGKSQLSPNFARVAMIGVLILAAGLRFYGISFGLPNNYHPDEVPKVNAIMRMVASQSLDPDYFLHPSLLLYSTYFTNTLFHYFGVTGEFRDTAFLAGRTVSAIAGILSVLLTYLIASSLFNRKVGVLSALFLCVFPLHVTCSRYLKEDSLLTFSVLLTVYVTVVAIQSKRPWLLLLSGLCAGIAASSKYSGLISLAIPLAAPWAASRSLIPDRTYLRFALAASVIMPIGFLMCTPYAYFNYDKFSKDFGSESRHMSTGHTSTIDAWSQLWMYHFYRSVLPGMQAIAAIICMMGFGALLYFRRVEALIVAGMVVLFYLPAEYVKAKPAPQPERYILPCLPFLAIAGALFATRLKKPLRELALTLLISLPLLRTLQLASELIPDTRDTMAQWMLTNIPKGSTIVMDWKPYAPRFPDDYFNVDYVHRARIIQNLDIKDLKQQGGGYLVMSSLFYDRYFSQPETDPALRQRIREVFERVPIVYEISPNYGTYGFHNPRLTLFSLKPEDFAKLEEQIKDKREGKIQETMNDAWGKARW